MKRIIILILLSTTVYAKNNQIGGLLIGSHNLINNLFPQYCSSKLQQEYEVSKTGINIGVLLPIRLTNLNLDYKIQISHHKINNSILHYKTAVNRYLCRGDLDNYSSGLNEILIGPTVQIKKHSIVPQLGFGFIVESLWAERTSGIIYSIFFYDISMRYQYDLGNYYLGLMVNLENGFYPGYSDFKPMKRLNISLLIIK